MRLHRLAVVSALVLSSVGLGSRVAHAAADSFGVGDGHSGPRNVAAANTVVNTYAGVTEDIAPGATTITITTQLIGGGTFAANDLVLVWRATGVADSEAPSGDQTKRLNLASALATTSTPARTAGAVGRFEFARVASVSGAVLTLTSPMLNGFTRNVTQVVRVPELTTLNVAAGASVVAAPWQELGPSPNPAAPNPNAPWAGGILIFLANGAITNQGAIHANGRGFHGGTPTQRPLSALGLFCDANSTDGNPTATAGAFAPKGEGVVQSKFTATTGGKGNISMAGGGGNCIEGGGGGGANQGNGGNGSATILQPTANGLGGVGIDYDLFQRFTMGGGGGSGRHIVGLASQVSFGGFGGGVVYIRGTTIAGTGVLQANGADGEDSGLLSLPTGVASEGSGGGGAGGTIIVRLTGNLDCSQLGSTGGNGGDAQVVGLGILGAGGGGGGGRVLYQAASKSGTCAVTVNPGNAGNNQGGGAENGEQGTTVPDLPPLCLPPSPGVAGTCPEVTPVCDPITGQCTRCSGPFGSGPPAPCQVSTRPVCATGDGQCRPCDGDFGSTAASACQLANAPTCFAAGDPAVAGSCGKCTRDADCANGTHAGPVCDLASGACGTACTKDEDCAATQWCAPTSATTTSGVCVPKVPNAQPVPAGPPINGQCTDVSGRRTCLSAVCEESDDLCGKRNSSPCPGGENQCRSSICFAQDRLCGLPNGQPCTGNGQCRSEQCQGGICTGKPCGSDTDCPAPGQVCDANTNTCVDGCRPGLTGPGDGGVVNGVCAPGSICIAADGSTIGNCQIDPSSTADGGASGGLGNNALTDGLIEGGGCACSSTLTTASSPLALLGALSSVLLLVRRRKSQGLRQ